MKPEKVTDVQDLNYAKIAEAIGKISDAGQAMRASGLSRTAIVVLLKDATGLTKRDVGMVLDAVQDLKRWCLSR